jgi:hypothetical protein
MKGWPLVMPTFGFRKTQTRINGVGGCLASITPESVEMSFHCQLKEPGQSWEGIVAAGLSGQKLQATFFSSQAVNGLSQEGAMCALASSCSKESARRSAHLRARSVC